MIDESGNTLGLGLHSPRISDDPRVKESIIAQMYGEFLGFLKEKGLEDGKEFKGTIQECFSCSKRYIHIWDMDETRDFQLVVYLCSTQFSLQFGICNKKTKEVTYRNKLENLRYKISNATEFELIDSHQDKFKLFFEDFKIKFNELLSEKRGLTK